MRPGRSVELVEAVLAEAEGERRRWRAPPPGACGSPGCRGPGEEPPPPGPDAGREVPFFPTGQAVGYHTAMDYRFVAGAFVEPGPAVVWMRMRQPLVADEPPSPLVRVLVAADSGNGVSAALDYRRFLFINTELTVHLVREAAGEWVCLDAVTRPGTLGVGPRRGRALGRAGPARARRADAARPAALTVDKRPAASGWIAADRSILPGWRRPGRRRARPHATSIRRSGLSMYAASHQDGGHAMAIPSSG